MKFTVLTFIALFTLNITIAQQNAVTEKGEEVILYENGTWEFKNPVEIKTLEIPVNPKVYSAPEASSFLLKSTVFNVGVKLNPKKWSFSKSESNMEAEYELELKNQDLYAMLISERVGIPLENMKNIAIENAKAAAPDTRLIKEEYRNVNGLKVLMLELAGTLQNIKFRYFGYYYSNEKGTIQLICYTSQSLIEEYRPFAEDLLNGLVELDN